jgi:hypothetical protein
MTNVYTYIYLFLPYCWLELCVHPGGPATVHLDTGFTGFLLFLRKC